MPSTAPSFLPTIRSATNVFDYNTADYLAGEPYNWYLVRTKHLRRYQTVEDTVNSLRFETVQDYDDWLGRMRNFPAYMDQNIGLMREGIEDHILLPKVIGEKVPHPVAWHRLAGPDENMAFTSHSRTCHRHSPGQTSSA